MGSQRCRRNNSGMRTRVDDNEVQSVGLTPTIGHRSELDPSGMFWMNEIEW